MMTHNRFPTLDISLPDFIVADPEGWVHFRGSRLGLSSVVRVYLEGYSPEMMASEFPAISLSTIHKTIAFYLEHRDVVDRYLEECRLLIHAQSELTSPAPSIDELRQRWSERALSK